MIDELRNGAAAKEGFARAYVPDALMKLIGLEAAIEARINKAVGRTRGTQRVQTHPSGCRALGSAAAAPRH